ncbi:MAG: leucyl aminopeptidase [Marinilabiliaceae bacterium]|nr:leucyl aminopeptidase [Marinilabiliaceae bacterium]
MHVDIQLAIDKPEGVNSVFLVKETAILKDFGFNQEALDFVQKKIEAKQKLICVQTYDKIDFVRILDVDELANSDKEALRKDGHKIISRLREEKVTTVTLFDLIAEKEAVVAMTEGLVLSGYRFDKYKTDEEAKLKETPKVHVATSVMTQCELHELSRLCQAVFITRDLVNEPVGTLDVAAFSDIVKKLGEQHGFSVDIFNKTKLESLKFGGLLAVNKGSVDPPAFHILEWKPDNATNEKPVVLVGKGVVYDTGGINLKTPPGSLDDMKSDMGGAASVVGAMVAVSSNRLPKYVVGLIPATDNRPGGNAIVPGDVLNMHNGTTVEVINTDAEGRLILADALSYSDKYDPALVVDLATLTGSAVMALGQYGTVGMGTASDEVFDALIKAGDEVHERIVRFPFWSEYDELIKSDIADIKNLGGREAGSITAGKFLSHFIKHPWVHLDIAGPAFVKKEDSYRGNGGSGVGVRMLYEFLKKLD